MGQILIMTDKPQTTLPTLPPAKYVQRENHKSAYFTLGEKGNEPLLLCHGLAANGLQFVRDAHFFAKKGYFVIVPDLRGLGRSTRAKIIIKQDYSITALASDLTAILDEEQIKEINWVGNSLGGILALSVLGTNKQRIKSLISFGTAYSLDVPEPVVPFMQFIYALAPREMMAWLGARVTCWEEDAQAIIYQMLLDADLEVVLAIAEHVRQYNLIDNALDFDGKILLVRGLRDVLVNHALKPTLKAMQTRSNFSLVDIEKAGHCANLDQPDKLRRVILDFLS